MRKIEKNMFMEEKIVSQKKTQKNNKKTKRIIRLIKPKKTQLAVLFLEENICLTFVNALAVPVDLKIKVKFR